MGGDSLIFEDIRFFSERRDLGQTLNVDKEFGGTAAGALAATEWSDLNADGSLPEWRGGDLTAVIFQHSPNAGDDATAYSNIDRVLDAGVFLELLQKGYLEVSVQGVTIVRGSLIHYGGNFPYYYGGQATNLMAGVGNVGMMRFLSHQLRGGDKFRCRVKTRVALLASANTGLTTSGSHVTVDYQVQTQRKVQ